MMIDSKVLKQLVYGGAVLGAGGGGSIAGGLETGQRALEQGKPTLVELSNLPDTAVIATISGVGTVSPSGVDQLQEVKIRAMELFLEVVGCEIAGFISSEVGPGAVTYGWRESVATGRPIVDAPCNGRAHPTGIMGSIGLHRIPDYETVMVAVGGSRKAGTYLEQVVKGSLDTASQLVRDASVRAGGAVAVVRNPVTVAYARKNAAVGGLEAARRVGEALLRAEPAGLPAMLQALCDTMSGTVVAEGVVQTATFSDTGGYTVGNIEIDADRGQKVQIPVCNEYMIAFKDGSPVAAFPDLIAILDATTGLPLVSSTVRPGQKVAVFQVPQARLILGSPMHERALLQPVESLLGVSFPS